MQIIDYAANPARAVQLCRRRYRIPAHIETRVREIVDAVEARGDPALLDYTRRWDCPTIDAMGLAISEAEVRDAYEKVSKEFLAALRKAKRNIAAFHRRQRPRSWAHANGGVKITQRYSPLDRVGIYVPGGKAAYPSTVLMNAIPAAIAGVKEIVLVTPPGKNGSVRPEILVAARECGLREMYRVGGAQAVAALAYGTESIRPVDKIAGPGNTYVAAAKRLVFGQVGIDMIAGPTEVVVVADDSADARFVAADLIAQAEHDEEAAPICLCFSRAKAADVEQEVDRQLRTAPRRVIAERAFDKHGTFILVNRLEEAAEIINALAPEHLELMVRNAATLLQLVKHAGSIFVGAWATEALGDYIVGANHTLPTSGTARFSSPLGVHDFVKFSNVISVSRRSFLALAPHVEVLAGAEGLDGHAASVRVRKAKQ
jgi:histidinol dehydrogenase